MHASARDDGRAAFRLLEVNCRRDTTDLEMFDLNNEWETATFLNTVGITIDTVTLFSRFINGLNARSGKERSRETRVAARRPGSRPATEEPAFPAAKLTEFSAPAG